MATLECNRCKKELSLLGSKRLSGRAPDSLLATLGQLLPNRSEIKIYFCDACGKVEFIVPEQVPTIKVEIASRSKLLELNTLLKLKPGESELDDVYQTVGRPFASHTTAEGITLCYRSAVSQAPHVILIDSISGRVKFVAIHNDHDAFQIDSLERAYGPRTLVMQQEGHAHWFFGSLGVAFLTENFADESIMYLQFFEAHLDATVSYTHLTLPTKA